MNFSNETIVGNVSTSSFKSDYFRTFSNDGSPCSALGLTELRLLSSTAVGSEMLLDPKIDTLPFRFRLVKIRNWYEFLSET